MRFLKALLAAAAVGAIVLAFRDVENGRWLRPPLPGGGRGLGEEEEEGDEEEGGEEPVLGYDGMDRETLIEWLEDADLDAQTLRRIARYERANQAREVVLDTVEDLLDGLPAR
ncbi:MAG TPA: hypothetical protein VFX98_18520 [Longimicrobiaceae bacterium]|nr:hypothetical protein [Longimicrobiaceae bacterium]